ncbi:PREDICTED: dormancy-associated protein homolog 3-like isoform X2 [Nelumbo nucifera]|uniref:Dormancy-associated protein homolog 3-like isoform X2 n=1 Tax=Nelumbo nucifera TaxID=4432 RepID=A0A1U8AT33_NELNU|nr:PREDICTED: dormancy-associated protein homolog 3-like isoform X2 [Nelumbo nucifera]
MQPLISISKADGGNGRSYGDESTDEAMRVTRSITIIKPPGNLTIGNGSPPVSPAGSTPPVSPFSGSWESNRFRRRSMSDAYERRRETGARSSDV